MARKSKKNLRRRISFSTSFQAYFNGGGCYSGSISAPTRPALLIQMEDFIREHQGRSEVITFESIKKTIEDKEVKGKFAVFRRIRNPFIANNKLSRYYNKFERA